MFCFEVTNRYKKDHKKARKQNKNMDLLAEVLGLLQQGAELPAKHCDHALQGDWKGYRDCHIQPDWLLIYKIDLANNRVVLARLGSHSELFK